MSGFLVMSDNWASTAESKIICSIFPVISSQPLYIGRNDHTTQSIMRLFLNFIDTPSDSTSTVDLITLVTSDVVQPFYQAVGGK